MPTVRDWEDYIDMEEELHLQETRKKFHQKKKSHNKQTWDKLEKSESEMKYIIFKGDDGKYYSEKSEIL